MVKGKTNKIVHSVRYLAMEILTAIETEGAYSNILLNATIEKEGLDAKDAGLLTTIVYGVTQRKLTLDYGLSPFIRAPKKLENWVLNLLRLSVYQMQYLDKVPDHAVLYDAVEIAKKKGHVGIAKLVNGILRNVQRKGLQDWNEITDPKKRISIGASVPEWLVKKFSKELGVEKAERLFFSLLEAPYVSVRVQNTEKLTSIMEELRDEGKNVVPSPLSPVGLRILSGKVTDSPLFINGEITIQDESSQLVALLGHLKATNTVLDACAAPGGKTVHMASFLDEGVVHALDIHDHKIHLIAQNADRMKVSNRVKTHLLDAKDVQTVFPEKSFDTIFVDAPCSGLGLMRRKPEIKYGVTNAAIKALHSEQMAILNAVTPLLKDNGRLVYSTCTLAPEENQGTIAAYLEEHPEMLKQTIDFNQVKIPETIGIEEGMLQIFPDDFGTDGFFICTMEKKTK
ncbi:16S rRNA (cytosine(967)-C(5))-methyltransferase RsmB [Jeotgalibaca sp. A127]|uniref:16S rRNA (cytosine(967)-C(5))-methyltransferase RsmB n=1 Tax=Jeotgalibaca sp. A127 TaxID=3457324 RepID=UPI003FD35108